MATHPHQSPSDDPFAEEKAPSLSFRDAAVGTTYSGTITRAPKMVQMRDFESGNPKTWPDGNPVMGAVLLLDIAGETRSLWATKPSSMFAALVQAQKEAGGTPMTVGGRLHVRFEGEVPNSKNPHLNPAKQYRAKYEPPAEAGPDPFDSQPAAAPQATPAAPPVRPSHPAPPTSSVKF